MRILIGSFLALAVLGFSACNKKPVQESPDVYEPSELALLMHAMEAENLRLRDSILAGSEELPFPKAFTHLTEAKPTQEGTINTDFHAHANAYKLAMERLEFGEGPITTRYNVGIQACVNCHNSFCNGPIPRIKKLFISG